MTKWFRWRQVQLEIQPISSTSTLLIYRLEWQRTLTPSWCFNAPERFAAHSVGETLLDNFEVKQ